MHIAHSNVKTIIKATIIRKDGTKEDLGVIASSKAGEVGNVDVIENSKKIIK